LHNQFRDEADVMLK